MKKVYISIAVFSLLLILFNLIATLRKSDKEVMDEFEKKGTKAQIYREKYNSVSIRYISDKKRDINLPTIIFIHGAPGSSADFYKHLQDPDLQKVANLVSIDRLGYGYSNFGKAETSIEEQAQAMALIAHKYEGNDIILVGWSYGGPIIGKMAIIEPTNYKHLIMLAPALCADVEKHFWFGNFAKWPLTRWMTPTIFQVAEDEKLAHTRELQKMDEEWIKIKTPITYYHGTSDNLVPYENMSYLQTRINDTILECQTIEDGSHFIPYKEYDLIKKKILSIIQQ